MAIPQLLKNNTPAKQDEDCIERQIINCEILPASDIISTNYKIQFPKKAREDNILPLAGGAVVSINIGELKLSTNDVLDDIITSQLSSIESTYSYNLVSLSKLHQAVNNSFYDIARKNLKALQDSKTAPTIFFSIYNGESLETSIVNPPDMYRICEFRYVPYQSFEKIFEIVSKSPNYKASLPDKNGFENITGVSGRSMGYLKEIIEKQNQTEDDVLDLVLEFFPIVNLTEDDLYGKVRNADIGGYYTIKDNNIFIKLPDLSGKNSVGEPFGQINSESQLYIEVIYNDVPNRALIENFILPPQVILKEVSSDNFPTDTSPLELFFEYLDQVDQEYKFYLSPVIDKPYKLTEKSKYINSYSKMIELFSLPIISGSQGIEEGRGAILKGTEDIPNTINAAKVAAAKYLTTEANQRYAASSVLDFPFIEVNATTELILKDLNANYYFGLKNRPDIIFTDEDGALDNKNEGKYTKLSSYGKIPGLESIMPKIYPGPHPAWIEGEISSDPDGGSENFVARFTLANFEGLKLSDIGGEAKYVAYIQDSYGQISRIPGPLIKISKNIPRIDRIVPNGFSKGPSITILSPYDTVLEIYGEDLDCVTGYISFDGEDKTNVRISLEDSKVTKVNSGLIILKFEPGEMQSAGFSLISQIFEVKIICEESGEASNQVPIFVRYSTADTTPSESEEIRLLEFKPDDFSSDIFGANPVVGIPLFRDGNNARIGIKSKSKVFKSDKKLFAYLALPSSPSNKEVLHTFCLQEKVVETTVLIKGAEEKILIAAGISQELSNSPFEDFFGLTKRKAILNFPGKKYPQYNFSNLLNIPKAYFVFTNKDIDPLISKDSNVINFSKLEVKYGVLPLGSGNKISSGLYESDNSKNSEVIAPAFIEPATILDMAISGTDGIITSTFRKDKYTSINPKIFDDSFSTDSAFNIGPLNVFGKIKNMVLIVSGIKENFISKRYQIFLDGKDISSKIFKKPKLLKDGRVIFELKNINPKNSGVVSISVGKKESNFGRFRYQNIEYIAQATAFAKESYSLQDGSIASNYYIDSETLDLIVTKEINTSSSTIEKANSLGSSLLNVLGVENLQSLDSLYKDTDRDGFLNNPDPSKNQSYYYPFLPIEITSSTKIKLNINEQGEDTTLFPDLPVSDVKSLKRSVLSVLDFSKFTKGQYVQSSNPYSLLFFSTRNKNLYTIKFNTPVVTKVGRTEASLTDIATFTDVITPNVEYFVCVKAENPNFNILFGERVLKPRVKPWLKDCGYVTSILIPQDILTEEIITPDCFLVCASVENEDRNRIEDENPDFPFDDDSYNPNVDQLPDPDFPDLSLIFPGIQITTPLTPRLNLKTLCDLSFSLTSELKISLNGFTSLMVPIQVIFCIIDVICSLLNPVKLARAIIRLFECLYDLVQLIPAISVPVMFLSLSLHILALVVCIFEKIIKTMVTVNEIIKAIIVAVQPPITSQTLKVLDETLEQHLIDIELDIRFLDPILSIIEIFLQLLQLSFRFPCSINPGDGSPDCGIDGTQLAGIILGIAAPELEIIPDVLIPVAQTYSSDLETGRTNSGNIVEPNVGDTIASNSSGSFLDSMEVDSDSLRGANTSYFAATFGPTFTKSIKKGSRSGVVEFLFKSKGLNESIDPNQTVDAPFFCFEQTSTSLNVSEFGNLYSPIDGSEFLDVDVDGKRASVKPLTLEFELDSVGADPSTGAPTILGTRTVTRTFDNIPKMALIDDEANVYFIEKDGIQYADDGSVKSIRAKVINKTFATKQKFSKEEKVGIDTDGDSVDDTEINLYDFPQLYLFDMRQAGDSIQQSCERASINSFPFEDNNVDDISGIVEQSQLCLQQWRGYLKASIDEIRRERNTGIFITQGFDIDAFRSENIKLESCIQKSVSDICRFVINSLNTSFKVLEDTDPTPNPEYVDGSLNEDVLDGFSGINPPFTGAREYAAGIGDNASIVSGGVATIEIIPRDSYDNELGGDFTDNIILEITGDETGGAKFIKNPDDSLVTKSGNSYIAKLTSDGLGRVKIRARICDRTIQALTYQGINLSDEVVEDTGCVPGSGEVGTTSPPIGALTKVDRILSVYFTKPVSRFVRAVAGGGDAELAVTEPQQFGTSMEN